MFFLFSGVLLCGCFQSTIQTKPTKTTPEEIFAFTGIREYIYIMDLSTGKCKNTKIKGDHAALSPDRKKIAFRAYEEKEGHYTIYLLDINGKNIRRATKEADGATANPAWFPDGKRIAFWWGGSENKSGIYMIDLNEGSSEPIILCSEIEYGFSSDFSLSPDGKKVVFSDGRRLYVKDTDTKVITQMAQNDFQYNNPTYSLDGEKIGFVSGRNLCVIDADGKNERCITSHKKGWGLNFPRWTSDSKRILYECYCENPFAPAFLWIVNLDGTGKRKLKMIKGFWTR